MEKKTIYVYLDDSGVLSKNEKCVCYAGLVFLSKVEKDSFVRQYKVILDRIKCDYCSRERNECNNECIEIKNSNIKLKDKRQFMMLIKKYLSYYVLIDNTKIYDHIFRDAPSKGRFTDYAKKMIIKDICKYLLRNVLIGEIDEVSLVLGFDESITRSNGYYDLKDGIIEELKYGMSNYQYGVFHEPILRNLSDVFLYYYDSKKNLAVQASDLIAGSIRRSYIDNKETFEDENDFIRICRHLP